MTQEAPSCPQNKQSTRYLLDRYYLPKQSLNSEHWRMNLHSCRTYVGNRSVLNTTATLLDCVAKPACSLNHIPKSPYYDLLTDPLLTLIPSKPQSRGACHLPCEHVVGNKIRFADGARLHVDFLKTNDE